MSTRQLLLFVAVIIFKDNTSKCFAFSTPPTPYGVILPYQREEVVRRYFDGVNKKDKDQIASCFAPTAKIRDVCSLLDSSERIVTSHDLADGCMEFLQAHPDCKVDFYYGPQCGEGGNWVVAHWYETGHWSGDSCGIKATGNPMNVEGQTRFLVNDDFKITNLVITRTFSEWEKALQQQQQNQ